MEEIKKMFEEELHEVTEKDLALVEGVDFNMATGSCGWGCVGRG